MGPASERNATMLALVIWEKCMHAKFCMWRPSLHVDRVYEMELPDRIALEGIPLHIGRYGETIGRAPPRESNRFPERQRFGSRWLKEVPAVTIFGQLTIYG
jgi:hypothetical protein